MEHGQRVHSRKRGRIYRRAAVARRIRSGIAAVGRCECGVADLCSDRRRIAENPQIATSQAHSAANVTKGSSIDIASGVASSISYRRLVHVAGDDACVRRGTSMIDVDSSASPISVDRAPARPMVTASGLTHRIRRDSRLQPPAPPRRRTTRHSRPARLSESPTIATVSAALVSRSGRTRERSPWRLSPARPRVSTASWMAAITRSRCPLIASGLRNASSSR
jgi:hypothetical protein